MFNIKITNSGFIMELSTEELDFFSHIFTESPKGVNVDVALNPLSVKTDVPHYLKTVLASSKLTLLAEISHYQLWFPVALEMNRQGDLISQLGTPEIIDKNGNERSWRVEAPKDVALIDVFRDKKIEVLSLSSTGVTLNMPCFDGEDFQDSSLEMTIAGDEPLKLELDLVRQDKNVVAAKFKNLEEGRESLRKFLFDSHKTKYSDLYQDIIL